VPVPVAASAGVIPFRISTGPAADIPDPVIPVCRLDVPAPAVAPGWSYVPNELPVPPGATPIDVPAEFPVVLPSGRGTSVPVDPVIPFPFPLIAPVPVLFSIVFAGSPAAAADPDAFALPVIDAVPRAREYTSTSCPSSWVCPAVAVASPMLIRKPLSFTG
jgi:hypothetical protein